MWPIANPFRKCELYHLSAQYLGRTGRGNAGGRYWDLSIALNIGFPDWYTGQAFFLKRFAEGSRCLLDAGGGNCLEKTKDEGDESTMWASLRDWGLANWGLRRFVPAFSQTLKRFRTFTILGSNIGPVKTHP